MKKQIDMNGPGGRYWSRTALAASLLALSGAAVAAAPGYVTSGGDAVAVTNAAGQCWTTIDWTPINAAAPCHTVTRTSAAPVPVVRAAPEPAPAPAPAPAAAAPLAPAPVIQRITLSTDVLFRFNSAELRPGAHEKLDELAKTLEGAEVDRIVAIGHADRIASEKYNEELSRKRAEAVKDYLVKERGVDAQRVETEGRGESQPVAQCGKMGPERASNQKLVSCLQPDRRVEIEVLGHREVAAGEAPSTSGAGSSASGGASTNPSSR
jgi:OOP family OmpA-OmpF porin